MGGEQSNTSLVYDERLILKLYRRPPDGPNPDAEVTAALAAERVPQCCAGGRAVVEGTASTGQSCSHSWTAVTMVGRPRWLGGIGPRAGDFVDEATRLGQVTAQLHVALAAAFGTHKPAMPTAWAETVVTASSSAPATPRIDNGRVGRRCWTPPQARRM